MMVDLQFLAKVYHTALTGLVRDGRAPHYTELASELGLSPNEARHALHDVSETGVPGVWLQSGTDYVATFAPFSNIPTQYLISVEAERKWYGQ